MMRSIFTAPLVCFATSAFAFDMDVEAAAVRRAENVRILQDLREGGSADLRNARFCSTDEQLYVPDDLRLGTTQAQPLSTYVGTRVPDGIVLIISPAAGQAPGSEGKDVLETMLAGLNMPCASLPEANLSLLPILSINGIKSASELMKRYPDAAK